MNFKYYIAVFLILSVTKWSAAQRINFKPFIQGEGITLNIVNNPSGLNFNNKQRIIVEGDPNPVTISLMDNESVVIELEAPYEYDLTVEFNYPGRLGLNGIDVWPTVPYALRFAYNNTGEPDDLSRRAAAVEVPDSYRVLTFPMYRRRAGGPPPPPPVPDHDGYVRPRKKSYIYVYGILGPVQSGLPTGNYSTTVEINVNYADNAY